MPFDTQLADRIRQVLKNKRHISERKMFGGVCFMFQGKMLCGVEKNNMVVRVGPNQYEAALKASHVRPMDFTGKPLRGFIYVSQEGLKSDKKLLDWIDLARTYVSSLPPK